MLAVIKKENGFHLPGSCFFFHSWLLISFYFSQAYVAFWMFDFYKDSSEEQTFKTVFALYVIMSTWSTLHSAGSCCNIKTAFFCPPQRQPIHRISTCQLLSHVTGTMAVPKLSVSRNLQIAHTSAELEHSPTRCEHIRGLCLSLQCPFLL